MTVYYAPDQIQWAKNCRHAGSIQTQFLAALTEPRQARVNGDGHLDHVRGDDLGKDFRSTVFACPLCIRVHLRSSANVSKDRSRGEHKHYHLWG
jgi:hypothetical protein